MAEREMLDRWAANIDERRTIEAFLDWCEEQRIELAQWGDRRWPEPLTSRSALLDRYHEIDQQQLDKERRALLAEATA